MAMNSNISLSRLAYISACIIASTKSTLKIGFLEAVADSKIFFVFASKSDESVIMTETAKKDSAQRLLFERNKYLFLKIF